MLSSIRARLTFWYVVSLSLLILIFSAVLVGAVSRSTRHDVDMFLADIARDIKGGLLEAHDQSLPQIIDEAIEEKLEIGALYIQVAAVTAPEPGTQRIVAKSRTLGTDSLPLSATARTRAAGGGNYFETNPGRHGRALRTITFAASDQGKARYIVQVATPLRGIYDTLGRLLVALLFSIPVLLIVLALLGYLSVGRAFAPVRRVVAAARRISAEDLSLRIPSIPGKDEISELIETFNQMLARLEHSFEQVKQFASDAAHELKTPLTAIRGELEVALRKERETSEYQRVLRSSLEEAARLQRIVDDLLLLARLDAQGRRAPLESVALDEVVLEAFEETSPRARENGLAFILKRIDEVSVMGNEVLLKRLLVNLIDNAVKYNRPGGTVTVALEQSGDGAWLTVADTGAGIPEEALPHIMDRFYQADRERAPQSGGTGLGLAIVKKAVEVHHGTVTVRSRPGEGTVFTILLPIHV